jgi:hypothetical protein
MLRQKFSWVVFLLIDQDSWRQHQVRKLCLRVRIQRNLSYLLFLSANLQVLPIKKDQGPEGMSKFGQQMKSGFGAVAAKAAANAGGLPRRGGMSILAAAVGVGAQRPV